MKTTKEIFIYDVANEDNLDDNSLFLCERSDEVDTIKGMAKAREIIVELKNILREKKIASLSAPAIGYHSRILCVNFADNVLKTFINPVITKADGLVLSDEHSVVLPAKRYLVPRNNRISLMYTTPLGKIESREISGFAAAIIQQELHLLDGILLSDIGLEIDEQFDNATQEEREEVINVYLDSLDIKQKEINKQIQEDPDLKQIADATDFMIKAEKGEIDFEKYDAPPAESNSKEKEKVKSVRSTRRRNIAKKSEEL